MSLLQHWLLFLGTAIFVAGLLVGLIQDRLKNKRMALSAHLVGVQHGMVLWILPFLLPHTTLGAVAQTWLAALAVYGLYAIWLAMLLAAFWGASRALPMAGAGFQATPLRETIVQLLIITGALTSVLAFTLLLWGFWPL